MPTPSRRPLNPAWLLVGAAAGFAGWVAHDAIHWAPPPAEPAEAAADPFPPEFRRARGFLRLYPGMPRPAVERALRGMRPAAEELADPADGDPVFRTRYEVFLPRPLPHAPPPRPFAPGRHVVTLTFDAARPGQPLIGLSADPLG
ncbi:MAG: hypothetical protein C0501_00405 [Isosphaera sp.]|nr:hypothetical protein [Isosphaera sp.]